MPEPEEVLYEKEYISPPQLAIYIGWELEKITSYSDIDDIIVHDAPDDFLSPEVKFANCIIEIAPDEIPFDDTPMIGGQHRYDYFFKIALRAKGKYLRKLRSIHGSEIKGMWSLYREVWLEIGDTIFNGRTEYPEGGNAISNILTDVDSDNAILQFDWTARIITDEMSIS